MLTATAHVRKSRKSSPKKDEDILKERFSMSFLGDYPSFHIARTMAEESSKNHEELVVSASTTWDRTNKCQSSNMHSLSLSRLFQGKILHSHASGFRPQEPKTN